MNDREFFERVDGALASSGALTDEQRNEIASQMTALGLTYEHALHQCAKVEPALYRRVLEEVSGCVAVDPSQITIDKEFIAAIQGVLPLKAIVALRVFPVSTAGNDLTLAMLNPTDEGLVTELQSTTSLRVRPVVTTHLGVQSAIERNFSANLRATLQELRNVRPGDTLALIDRERHTEPLDRSYEPFLALVNREFDSARGDRDRLAQLASHPLVVSFVQKLLGEVIRRNCSDIHLEPARTRFRVRARINGVLSTVNDLPRKAGEVVSLRVRAMAGVRLQDSPEPLDAQINYSPVFGRRIEFRVSVLPTLNGAKTVMRLLEKQNQSASLDKIGLTPSEMERVNRNISAPSGLLLVTGPTGSGKTSTLYSILGVLNDDERCIVTAEEPVESEVPGVVQVPCGAHCSFASALRSFLRQDPDVIMVGEIRDQETADIALKAALTGHLVLSTLHTNDAPTAVMRLLNLDMDPFIVASSIRLVIAQRLIRTLCNACKRPITRDDILADRRTTERPVGGTFAPHGCPQCNQTGYTGRIGVFEILEGTDEMADAINRRANLGEIRAIAERHGMMSLRERAMDLYRQGRTSLDEVIRVTAE